MNKTAAKQIAENISNQQLKEMFDNAKENITDWKEISSINKGMTKGTAWNILAANFDVNKKQHFLAKTNMVREFGEFLSNELKPKKKVKQQLKPPTHQEPKF